jgi:hypothetical protein
MGGGASVPDSWTRIPLPSGVAVYNLLLPSSSLLISLLTAFPLAVEELL